MLQVVRRTRRASGVLGVVGAMRNQRRRWVIPLILPAALLAGLATCGWVSFGSAAVPFQYLSGRSIIVNPRVGVVDTSGGLGSVTRAKFHIINMAAKPLRLIGTQSSCTCLVTGGLSATVQSWGRHELDVAIHLKDGDRPVDETLILFADDGRMQSIPLSVRGAASR